MTRKQLFAVTALAVAVTTAACDKPAASNDNGRVAARFASTGTDAARTRVNGTEWEGTETIGIYMVANGTTDVVENAGNIPYSTSSEGTTATFTPVSEETAIYYPVTTPARVDFIAYYPHQEEIVDWTYPVDVATQASQGAIDLLLARADNAGDGYDKTRANPVGLAFTHQLVKLNLTVVAGPGVTSLAGLAVSIEGMYTTAGFDLTGTAGFSNEADEAPITPRDAGNNAYEAILLPVETLGAGHVITFTISPDVYTWHLTGATGIDSGKLEGGKKYDYTVTLHQHALTITGTINDWTPGDSGSGTAE